MQADVLPLFIFNVDLGFRLKSFLFMCFGLPIFNGDNLGVAAHDIVTWSRNHALGKFTPVIGKKFPVGVLLAERMYFNFNAIKRAVIGSVSGAKDESVMLYQILIVTGK